MGPLTQIEHKFINIKLVGTSKTRVEPFEKGVSLTLL